jgi:UDP-N-acetylmuramoyl-L-alanyl-D-glutamate--2,6-diaminopimelate ligase
MNQTTAKTFESPQFSLRQLAEILGGEVIPGKISESDPGALQCHGVSLSSKLLKPGELFVAISGYATDGHQYIPQAFAAGAVAAVVTRREALTGSGYPGIVVPDTRLAVSTLAALFTGEPSKKLQTFAVTGTNGKTTIHWLLYHTLNLLGTPAARLGTIGFEAPGISRGDTLTTPDPVQLHQLLREGLDAGAKAVTLELSSHALHQARAHDLDIDVGIFTNLTRDHLDYHGTMEEYFKAKAILFDLVKQSHKGTRSAVINADDEYGKRYIEYARGLGLKVLTYGQGDGASIRFSGLEQDLQGSSVDITIAGVTKRVRYPAIGLHNAYNFAAVVGALVARGYDAAQVLEAASQVKPVPGRLEPVGNERIGIFVDYAHTPDALENVLRTMREVTKHTVWVVFGCGGDRDKGKRPIMAEVAARLADKAIVTSDNPRTEDPQAIINDILAGGAQVYKAIVDRREAIQAAVQEAQPGDVVLIAGKGHEDYQILGKEKVHFSDQEEARKALM